MELTKERIAKWIGDPNLLRRMVLRSTFLGDYKYILDSGPFPLGKSLSKSRSDMVDDTTLDITSSSLEGVPRLGFTTDRASKFSYLSPNRTNVGEQDNTSPDLSTGDTATSVCGVLDSSVSPTPQNGVDRYFSGEGIEKLNKLGVLISWEIGSFEEEDELIILFKKEDKKI
ncbi:hypothetical protein H5410_050449 [Solanum commersonii]|uniref:Uncharacterized protein n=1 Tax=Solanum commersonii TaxID=4109 RepID=A0A9J5WXZ1_SOLCO|nr:hypothetical protein H5410_050449 [Solanum commersonii]